MKTRVVTLFGEEIIPEQVNAVGRSRALKKKKEEEKAEGEEIVAEKPAKTKKKAEKVSLPEVSGEEDILPEVPEALKSDKAYYSIGEVASMFKVKTSNIRFWTIEFTMKVRTTRKGDRLYTPDQIRELRTIYHLVKEKRYTISGAKAKLKSSKKMTGQSLDLKDSLLQLRNKLLSIRNQLI